MFFICQGHPFGLQHSRYWVEEGFASIGGNAASSQKYFVGVAQYLLNNDIQRIQQEDVTAFINKTEGIKLQLIGEAADLFVLQIFNLCLQVCLQG